MATHKVITTDAEIETAMAAAAGLPTQPRAVQVKFLPDFNLIVVRMDNGDAHSFFVPKMQGLGNMTRAQIARVTITGLGSALTWEDQDLDLHIPSLIEGIYGTRAWMAELGRKGGASRSLAKSKASRENGARGGRPKRALTLDQASILAKR